MPPPPTHRPKEQRAATNPYKSISTLRPPGPMQNTEIKIVY